MYPTNSNQQFYKNNINKNTARWPASTVFGLFTLSSVDNKVSQIYVRVPVCACVGITSTEFIAYSKDAGE